LTIYSSTTTALHPECAASAPNRARPPLPSAQQARTEREPSASHQIDL